VYEVNTWLWNFGRGPETLRRPSSSKFRQQPPRGFSSASAAAPTLAPGPRRAAPPAPASRPPRLPCRAPPGRPLPRDPRWLLLLLSGPSGHHVFENNSKIELFTRNGRICSYLLWPRPSFV
jgi:hypothetical protein